MDDDDGRRTELDTLEAIFPELVRKSVYSVSLEVPVALAEPMEVTFPAVPRRSEDMHSLHDHLSFRQVSQGNDVAEVHHFWNLPPLLVTISLPDEYPSKKPPDVELRTQYSWLPNRKTQDLGNWSKILWDKAEHDQIVYSFIERLQEDAETCFGLAKEGALEVDPELKVALLNYDKHIKAQKFNNETFNCDICIEPKKGAACHRLLGCSHVFCKTCLKDFYNSCISEGAIDTVKCLNPECSKQHQAATNKPKQSKKPKWLQPTELAQIGISTENIQRYIKLRKKRKLETNPNTVYCPRRWCQGPARVGNQNSAEDGTISGSDAEDESDVVTSTTVSIKKATSDVIGADVEEARRPALRPPSECLAVCLDCSFAFCLICKRSWHGELGYCIVRNEKIFSREEKASEEYLEKYTTPCPTCNARAQKTMGCNHMICRQCNTHFCYLCSSWLDSSNPYKHFNTGGAPCYQKLWELEGGDGEGAPARHQPPPVQVIFEEPNQERQRGGEIRGVRNQRAEAPEFVPPPAPQPPLQANGVRVRRRAHQGVVRPAGIAVNPLGDMLQGHGLQRFLDLAARDEEDGWDSDELEDQFAQFVVMDQ